MVTSNKNLLSLTGFKLQISGKEYENAEYFAVSASLPSISLPEIALSYRNKHGYLPGDKVEYDPINIRIAVDEGMYSYEDMFKWIKYNVTQQKLDVRDITLSVLTSHNNISRSIKMTNAFPTSLGQIEFNAQSTEVEYAYFDVTFRYDYFEFI